MITQEYESFLPNMVWVKVNVFLLPNLSGKYKNTKFPGIAGIIVSARFKWGFPDNFVPMYKVPP